MNRYKIRRPADIHRLVLVREEKGVMLKEQVYERIGEDHVRTGKFKVRPYGAFQPFLKFEDRKDWEGLEPRLKAIITEAAMAYEGFEYPMLKAADYMEYYRSGSRTAYETPYFQRRHALSVLILDYCVSPAREKLDRIIDGIWCICEESSWVVPAHNFIYEPEPVNSERTLPDLSLNTLDIFAGETGMLLSLCHYLLKQELDQVDPLVGKRIYKEVRHRIMEPFLTRYDYWWMGYSDRRDINNWGPWCVMNCLISILFCEPDTSDRKRGIVRAMDMMDYYMQGIGDDGGCDEGATYWGRACGMLLEGLSLIHYATYGEVSAYREEKLVRFADYIRNMYIGEDYVVNFADGSARCNPAAEIIYTAGLHMENQGLKEFGAYCFQYQTEQRIFPLLSLSRALSSIQKSREMLENAGKTEFEPDEYIESLEIMVARQERDAGRGFYLCAKGGSNGDSHNHNDAGNVVCFCDGKPVLVDVGVEGYRKESFGPDRYQIWTMQSQYHNLPTIGGRMQKEGAAFGATHVVHRYDGVVSSLVSELQTAYPNIEHVRYYKREAALDRAAGRVMIRDWMKADRETEVALHFMTPCPLELATSGIIFHCGGEDVIMNYDAKEWKTEIETLELKDSKLKDSWGNFLYRLTVTQVVSEGEFCFLIEKRSI